MPLLPPTFIGVVVVVVALLLAIIIVIVFLLIAYIKNKRFTRNEVDILGSSMSAKLGIVNPRVNQDKWEVSQQV